MKKIFLSVSIFCMLCLFLSWNLITNIKQEKIVLKKEESMEMKIKVIHSEKEIIFLLNDSQASKTLYKQLPLEVEIENYSHNEKIFYPTQPLDITNTPLLEKGNTGTLGYFSPWDNVIMYYGQCSFYSGLYILGQATKGNEYIKEISGKITIEKED